MVESFKEPRLSIHTATYNRGYIIGKEYKSLQNQTCHDFEWVVTDDGSTDNTEELFRKWCYEENRFTIRYEKVEHGGKPRALNHGIKSAKGEYFFMLDSDDYLLSDAVEKLLKWIDEIDNIDNIVGVGVARCYPNGDYMKGIPPQIDDDIGFIDIPNTERKYYDLDADMSEAYKVRILKKFPFKVWHNELFAPEQISLNEMAMSGYKVRWHKDRLYVCDYLTDGLTKGHWDLLKNNPLGHAMSYNQMLQYERGFITLFKCACQHIALSIIGKEYKYIFKSNKLWLTLFALPAGGILSIRRKIQFNK